MAMVIFYEKPGCLTNARQKQLLVAAGHTVIARNLLTEAWSAARLREFFGDRPVREWFNASAPAIKSGHIHPERLDEASALARMLEDPLLIRRPLWEVAGVRQVGFEPDVVAQWLGLSLADDPAPDACAHTASTATTGRCA